MLGAMTASQKPPIVIELEKLFGTLNHELFEGRLKLPTITIHPEKKVGFKFIPSTYHLVVGNGLSELTFTEMIEAFLHAMVHIQVAAKRNYHSKKFLAAALEVGFYVAYTSGHGWGATTFDPPRSGRFESPSKEGADHLQQVVAKLFFNEKVLDETQDEMRHRTAKPFLLKYKCGCPPPHNSIRSGRRPDGPNPLNIRCCNCNQLFRCEEG
jgi:hypothetical protein